MIKKIGRFFFVLKQENERAIGQSVLIVDNGYSGFWQLNLAIQRIINYFPKAGISVLTFEHRKSNLQTNFPALKFIIPSQRLRPKRYQIALEMLGLCKERYDFVAVFSLDTTPLIASLIFLKPKKLILYNQWGQWWSLRLRNIGEIFKGTYVKQERKSNFKNLLKRIGLFFVLLQETNEDVFKYPILLVDNSCPDYVQIHSVIQRIKESLPYAKISVLSLEQRRELKDKFPDIETIKAGGCIIKKYRIARHVLRLRKNKYDNIILLSLDVTPIIASILFIKSKVLLYNQWHQWWSLTPKTIRQYLMTIPIFIFRIMINILIFIYLLISVSWIFLKKSFNVFRINLSGKRI